MRRHCWLRLLTYVVSALALVVVFLMYFRADLVMDLANFIWRCA